MIPTGFRFNPTDEELIDILTRKVSSQEMPLHDRFIVERNIYELDPRDFHWDQTVVLPSNERYCYYMRETDSREVPGRGWWRATGHVKKIYAHNKTVVGYKRPLTFIRFRDTERKRKNAFKTNWIMHEYSLDSNATEWRLCKIKCKGKASAKEELEDLRKGYRRSIKDNNFEANNNSSLMVMQLDFGDEEQHQPQLLKFNNNVVCEPHDHCEVMSSSMRMQLDSFINGEQQQKPQALYHQVDDYHHHEVHETYNSFRQNMQMEVDDDHHQQQQQQSNNASYDPILTHITSSDYYLDDHHLDQPDSSEELFPKLWSW